MFFESNSQAAGMPVYDRLQPITANVNAPTAVALDDSGNIYIAESSNHHVLIYGNSGDLRGTISGFQLPISVAVDGSGRIYVGDKTDGYVEVYDSNFNPLFKLGTGDREFVQPNDIAINSLGKIYVADMETDMVRIYNAAGSYNGSFGGAESPGIPTGDGKFNRPTSI
jgi:sugar lactone lactonase YvrE